VEFKEQPIRVLTIMTANALQKPVEKRGGGTENRRLPKSKKSLTIINAKRF